MKFREVVVSYSVDISVLTACSWSGTTEDYAFVGIKITVSQRKNWNITCHRSKLEEAGAE